MAKVRYCKDCKYYRHDHNSHHVCVRNVKGTTDYVTGKPKEVGLLSAYLEREGNLKTNCSLVGRFFKPKLEVA